MTKIKLFSVLLFCALLLTANLFAQKTEIKDSNVDKSGHESLVIIPKAGR